MLRINSFEYLKEIASSNKLTLLELIKEDRPRDNLILSLQCEKGHEFEKRLAAFKKVPKCPICDPKNIHLCNIERIRKEIESRGCKLISEQYKNAHQKLHIQCSKGHDWFTNFHNFTNTSCPHCVIESKRITAEEVIKRAESKKCKVIKLPHMINSKNLVTYECPKGHNFEKSPNSFDVTKNPCPHCNGTIQTEKHKSMMSDIKYFRKKMGRYGNGQVKFSRTGIAKEFIEDLRAVYKLRKEGEHVDHAVPMMWFNHYEETQFRACWSRANLQILKAAENISKHDDLTLEQFLALNESQLQILLTASNRPEYANQWLKQYYPNLY